MNPPARPIRTELNDAVVGGIRQRGPEAVGLLIIGLTRIVLAVLVLGVMLFASSVLGFNVTAVPFAAMSGLSAFLSWLITRDRAWLKTGIPKSDASDQAGVGGERNG